MENKITLTLPKLGESIVGATVVKWLKREGDRVMKDEALLEVSTDKVNSEIPSPQDGVLQEILAKEEEEIEVGAPLATLLVGEMAPREVVKEERKKESCPYEEKSGFYSPALLRLAQMENISLSTLEKIKGTGEGGRVTKQDLEKYIASKKAPVEQATTTSSATSAEERVKLTGMRKAIAENMVRSFYEAPHASLVAEADVTEVMQVIQKEKERFFESHGVKLTFTPFLIQAFAKALQQFPLLNASLEGETIVMKRYINIGVAVHVDHGLLVPVVKNCEERTLVSIAKSLADLVERARGQKLAPDEVKGGTVTLTNFGMADALIGVPIIRYPEVAILGVGTIQKRVVVREDDSMAVRKMVYLTLTFDHRVIDGIYGCSFLSCLKRNLETI